MYKIGKTIFVRDELLGEVGITAKTLKEWGRLQLLKPDGFTKGQIPFYSKDTLERIKHIKGVLELGYGIKDLQLFGYTLEEIKEISDLFRYFLTIKNDLKAYSKEENTKTLNKMLKHIQALFERMRLMREGMERWEDLLKSKKKEILDFKNQNQKRSESKGTVKNE